MAPLLLAALPLISKIPALAQGIAGIFGKKIPETVNDAINLAGEVTGMIKKGQVPPEQMVMLEAKVMEHKEEIMKLQNERADIERQGREDEMNATIRLWGQEVQSKDIYVSRTRPMILRKLFYACIGYAFFATALVALMTYKKIPSTEIISLATWIGGTLFGTFSAAFLGYTAARTVDKKNPNTKNTNSATGKLLNMVL